MSTWNDLSDGWDTLPDPSTWEVQPLVFEAVFDVYQEIDVDSDHIIVISKTFPAKGELVFKTTQTLGLSVSIDSSSELNHYTNTSYGTSTIIQGESLIVPLDNVVYDDVESFDNSSSLVVSNKIIWSLPFTVEVEAEVSAVIGSLYNVDILMSAENELLEVSSAVITESYIFSSESLLESSDNLVYSNFRMFESSMEFGHKVYGWARQEKLNTGLWSEEVNISKGWESDMPVVGSWNKEDKL